MSGPRKKIQFRKEPVAAHVVTSDSREKSHLAQYPKVLKAFEDRRGVGIIVPDTVKMFGMHKLSVKELEDLLIDTRYQRDEVTAEVNTLIAILKRGGLIPDPISVAERKYGDKGRYIVDGQQRWWAHVDTGTPIHAVIYHVHTYEEEVALFHALNSQSRVMAEDKLRSLPGALGDTLRRLNESDASHLKGMIKFEPGTQKISAMIMARGLTALISNTNAGGGLERSSSSFNMHYKNHPRIADKFCDAYAWLVASIFNNQRLSHTVAIGFGRACYAAWTRTGDPELPTAKQIEAMRRVVWSDLTPTHAIKWLPVVLDRITSIWPVDIIKIKEK